MKSQTLRNENPLKFGEFELKISICGNDPKVINKVLRPINGLYKLLFLCSAMKPRSKIELSPIINVCVVYLKLPAIFNPIEDRDKVVINVKQTLKNAGNVIGAKTALGIFGLAIITIKNVIRTNTKSPCHIPPNNIPKKKVKSNL